MHTNYKMPEKDSLISLYGDKYVERGERIEKAIKSFTETFGDGDFMVFSVPGRSEICGNHTDHNHGEVFAASINLDIIAVARKTDSGEVRLLSEGFSKEHVGIGDLTPKQGDEGKSSALIRGMLDGFVKNGHEICSFDCFMTSNVLGGSGLSSSAAFEVAVGTVLNHLANDGKIDYIEVSKIAQYAENVHFGKPCGLMDQIACASGGFVNIDFADPKSPKCVRLPFDIDKHGYALCIISTGGSHADLTDDYASVPAEMKKVASFFKKDVLRGITINDIIKNTPALREFAGDRAILRAIHFISENERVENMRSALEKDDIDTFLDIINESGRSSAEFLQNYYSAKAPTEQGITLGYAISKALLGGRGAVRVHGGGFAGTVQAFVPKDMIDDFKEKIENVFGKGSLCALFVRKDGAVRII